MQRSVNKRPKLAGPYRFLRITAKEPGTNRKKDMSAKSKSLRLRTGPRKWLEFRQPCVLEPRQLDTGYAPRQKLAGDGLETWLGRSRLTGIEILEPFAPPCEANGAEARVTARRDDIGKSKIEVPERGKRWTDGPRQLLERDLAVAVEPPISDNRRPSRPRPRWTP
jgi:hypothetical protein